MQFTNNTEQLFVIDTSKPEGRVYQSDITDISLYPIEAEVLFNCYSGFKVTNFSDKEIYLIPVEAKIIINKIKK